MFTTPGPPPLCCGQTIHVYNSYNIRRKHIAQLVCELNALDAPLAVDLKQRAILVDL